MKMINKHKTEIKWAIIFAVVMLLWITLEKLVGLHSEHIDKHPIYTNFFSFIAFFHFFVLLLNNLITLVRESQVIVPLVPTILHPLLNDLWKWSRCISPITSFLNLNIVEDRSSAFRHYPQLKSRVPYNNALLTSSGCRTYGTVRRMLSTSLRKNFEKFYLSFIWFFHSATLA